MYGRVGLASGAIAGGALLVAGMRAVTWAIAAAAGAVLVAIMLYRLGTLRDRR
jgi:hypothetical protein